ncbi:hypothetical protein EUGRSUZ_H01641 [Eucalyptus grandis]|uniref:Uncharacterized protein n=1 Tax=Eucalyptus grandis TaxID=71139 RepID=A0ACC3JP94_EUCGR|nr:hypothetical protein EUGRSUZ_H01641 [Eucalyptus grandis]
MAAIEEAKGPDFSALPEGCIARVVSLTSPADACRLATLSPSFKSACNSDVVWASFLPPECPQTVSRSVSSLKELYFSLCDDPVLIGDGKMSYSLDRHSGKKCIMLSARALSITWGDTPIYWSWICLPNSRFAEVAELIDVCWLEIRGMITSHGLKSSPLRWKARFAGDEAGKREHSVYLSRENNTRGWQSRQRFRHAGGSLMLTPAEGSGNYPKERQDGWSEIELGEFLTKEGQDGEVEMSVMETKGGNWKAGLVVEGIEIRPKDGK